MLCKIFNRTEIMKFLLSKMKFLLANYLFSSLVSKWNSSGAKGSSMLP